MQFHFGLRQEYKDLVRLNIKTELVFKSVVGFINQLGGSTINQIK